MTIKDLMKIYNLTPTQMSKMFGIPYRTAQSWHLGDRKCPQYVVELLQFALDNDYQKYPN